LFDRKRQQNESKRLFRSERMAAISASLALLSCYGTTVLIGLLSLMGVSLAVNPRAGAATIVFLAGLAVVRLLLQWWHNRRIGPVAMAVLALGLIAWVMVRSYNALLEAVGFASLLAAVIWDASRYRL